MALNVVNLWEVFNAWCKTKKDTKGGYKNRMPTFIV